jgi:hypothetical protein
MRPWQRLVPLAAAVFLAAGVLAVSGPLPAASAATQPVPPGLGGRNWIRADPRRRGRGHRRQRAARLARRAGVRHRFPGW